MRRSTRLTVYCPRCGKPGVLYKCGGMWIVDHDTTTHYVRVNESLRVPLSGGRLNLIKYYGGDTFLLPYIACMIPPHKCYVEVFGGGAPLLLNKPRSPVEVYNDLDGNLYTLFKVVREKPREFTEALNTVVYSRQLFYEFLRKLRSGVLKDDVERAVATFYVYRASMWGRGERFGTSKTKSEALGFFNAVKRIRVIHERLKNVVVENLDFRECIRKYDAKDTFFYCDPPHIYIGTEKEPSLYLGFTDRDYVDLLNTLAGISGKFLLKHAQSTDYPIKWAGEHGFSVTYVDLKKATRPGVWTSAPSYRVYFIANYELPSPRELELVETETDEVA